jgi:hypothetical protein
MKKEIVYIDFIDINMSRHRFSAEEIANCRRFLLAWYDINKRKLPWRDWHDIDTNIVAYRGLKERRCMR